MRYVVMYMKPKKKGYSEQSATFFELADAIRWENYIKESGAKNVKICVK